MNREQRLELARWAVGQARKSGADQVAVNLSQSRRTEIQYRDGRLDQLKESIQSTLSLSIYADSRYSGHSTNDLNRQSLGRFIGEAVAMTRYLSRDPYRSLPDPKYYQGRREIDLRILDPGHGNIDSAERVRLAREIEEAAKAQSDKIVSCTGDYRDSRYESVKIHSNGFEGEEEGTLYISIAEVAVDDGRGGRPNDYAVGMTRFYKDLPDPEALGREAAARAMRKIGQAKTSSGLYDMIVENRVAGQLVGALYQPMQARALQQRRSFLEGRLGDKIGSEKLTVIDDPFVPSGLGSRLYDSEGLAARRRVMIDQGVLKSFYVDNYYGRKLDMEPTTGGSSNIVMEYGTKSLDRMIGELKKGILVSGFIGGNSNSTTGDFSFGITGLLVENGEIARPVYEMNISGYLTGLWNQLAEVGNDPYPYSGLRLPSMKFKDIQFSGTR